MAVPKSVVNRRSAGVLALADATPLRLRQHGTAHCIYTGGTGVLRSMSAKTETQKKLAYRSAEGWIADCVRPDY